MNPCIMSPEINRALLILHSCFGRQEAPTLFAGIGELDLVRAQVAQWHPGLHQVSALLVIQGPQPPTFVN